MQKTTSNKLEIVNIRLSRELISYLDSLIEKGIYNSRSEAIRDFCRDYVLEQRNMPEQRRIKE